MTNVTCGRREILAAATAGVTSLGGCSRVSSTDSTAQPTQIDGWPSVYHDRHNTNHNPRATPPTTDPRIRWRATDHVRVSDAAETTYIGSQPRPILVDGRLYLGGEWLTCYDAVSGQQLWHQRRDGRFVVGLVATEGQLHTVERATTDSDSPPAGHLSVVDAATGARSYTTTCGERPLTPVTDGDRVVVPTHRGHVGFDAAGIRRWTVTEDARLLPASPAAFGDESFYFPMPSQFGRYSSAFDPIGSLTPAPDRQWAVTHRFRQRCRAPTVSADGVLVPLSQMPLPSHQYDTDLEPGLYAYGRDGTRQWHLPVPTEWMDDDASRLVSDYDVSTPAVADGVGYVVTSRTHDDAHSGGNATLQAFDTATGTERWRVTFPGYGGFAPPPVVADGCVYAVLTDTRSDRRRGRLVAHEVTGDRLWSVPLSGPGYHLAAVGELLYVTLRDGVVAYGPA